MLWRIHYGDVMGVVIYVRNRRKEGYIRLVIGRGWREESFEQPLRTFPMPRRVLVMRAV